MAKRRSTRRKNDGLNDETIVDIVEARDSLQDYFEKNKTLVTGVIGIIILLVGGYMFYKYGIIKPKEKAVMESMYQAEYQFARDSFALALENPGGEAEGFLDIIDNYSGTEAANTSKYYAGLCYLNLGRFEEAIEYLEYYSPSGNITPAWRNGALGDAYAETNDLDKAMDFYKKAASYDDDASGPYYLMKMGLLAKKLGDNKTAEEAFSRIKKDYPRSPQNVDASKFLSLLNAGQ